MNDKNISPNARALADLPDDEFARMITAAAEAFGLPKDAASTAAANVGAIKGLLSGMSDEDITDLINKIGGGLPPK